MSCPARLGAFAAVSLVLLRLATGWHFFQEGTQKLNDPTWTSAGFLLQAKGPLADFYHSKVPQVHGWRTELAQPRELAQPDENELARREAWEADYAKEVQTAKDAGEPTPFKIAPFEPYAAWAQRISDDWEQTLQRFFQLPDLSEEAKEAASTALAERRGELLAYLEEIKPEVEAYQHELYRLEQLKKQAAKGDLPYLDERIAAKEAETARAVQPWLVEVSAIEQDYHNELRRIHAADLSRRAADELPLQEGSEAGTSDVAANAEEQSGDDAEKSAAALEGLPPNPVEASIEDENDAADEVATPAEAGADASEDEASADDAPADDESRTIDEVLVDSTQADLELADKIVTWSHLIIGGCLILGLFTPLAALGGAVFLAMVISTQPPLVPGTQETYYQFVEMFSLLVLAATCAGRLAGLDYFIACLFGKCRRSE